MKVKNNNSYNYIDDDSINLLAYAKKIWKARKLILRFVGIFFLIGFITALINPVVYESQTTFVPQTSDENSSINKGYAQLASLAGINLNAETSSSLDNYISPLLYSKIIESDEFSMALLNDELQFLDGNRSTIKNYILSQSSTNLFNKFSINLFKSDDKETFNSDNIQGDYNFISNEDYNTIKLFKEKFAIELNEKQGYIKVIAQDKDAFVSSQLVELITKKLQSRIISLRTNKIKEQLDYSRNQYKQKQDEFEILQKKLAEFRDSNKNISTAIFMAELQKLEAEYQLQQRILVSLATEYNQNKIKLNKDTPIFSVLDEVSIPNERSKPKRSQIVLIYVFIGLILSIGYILSKDPLYEIIQEINQDK